MRSRAAIHSPTGPVPSPRAPRLFALHPHRGSALPDLLVIIAVITLLLAILLPMLLSAKARAARAKCADNLREIASAISHYAQDNQRHLPSTRPATGPAVVPDLSNSGKNAPDPFSLSGPRPNNIPAILFLLLRTEQLSPHNLVCPATHDLPDTFEGQDIHHRSNFTDINLNLSYAIQNPYPNDAARKAGFKWTLDLPPNFVILADKGPAGPSVGWLTLNSPPEPLRRGNSPNHDRDGQNVLFIDGRVEFFSTPLVGIDADNIYATQLGARIDSPASPSDSILLPPARE